MKFLKNTRCMKKIKRKIGISVEQCFHCVYNYFSSSFFYLCHIPFSRKSLSQGGRLACADPWGRSPISACGICFYNCLKYYIYQLCFVEISLYFHEYTSLVATTNIVNLALALPTTTQLTVNPVSKLADSSVHSRVPEHKH